MATADINNEKIFVETTQANFNDYKTQAQQDNSVVFIKDEGLIWARDHFYGVSKETIESISSNVANNSTNITKLGTALKWKGPNDDDADTIGGSGSITPGGGGSGSDSTVINNYMMSNITVIEHTASETSVELKYDTYNIWPEVSSLSITLKPRSDNYLAQYMFEFISGTNPTVLTLPQNVQIAGPLTIVPSKRYQVSIVNNIAVIISVDSVSI